jgi:hypothetical protein
MREVEYSSVVGGIRREESGAAVCDVDVHRDKGEVRLEERIRRYRRIYRGGVEVSVEISATTFGAPSSPEIESIRQKVHRSRPSTRSPVWSTV